VIKLGQEQCRRIEEAATREWVVANGIGGFASATIVGMPTRRYHGLLAAALPSRAERTMLLTQCEEMVTYEGRPYQISTMEYVDGTMAPAGYIHLAEFRLEHGLPVTVYEIGDTTLEKRLWMAYGRNTTYVRYTLAATAAEPVELRLRPLASGRAIHELRRGRIDLMPPVSPTEDGCTVPLGEPATTLHLRLVGGWFEIQPDWYWHVLYRREREHGVDYVEDLFAPGTLAIRLQPGAEATLIVSAEPPDTIEANPTVAWRLETRRRAELEQRAGLPDADHFGRALVMAADSFIVSRASDGVPDTPARRSIIAGYPWFGEHGRDVLVGLPGLTLTTERANDARAILTSWLSYRRDGLLPARFNDQTGLPDYDSADTTLWLFVALRAYLHHTGDATLLDETWEALVEIVTAHEQGTRFGIGVDPADGLLRAGEAGYPVTWMTTRAGEWTVTPRRGKPVEINALWYSTIRQMAEWAEKRGDERAQDYAQTAERIESSFNRRFWYAPGGYLFDVIETEAGDDIALRPNQVMSIGLPFAVLSRDRWRPVLDAVTDHLVTPYGLRSLSPGDPHYVGWYAGDLSHRASAYHQGTVWPWLLGPYVEAYVRVYGSYRGGRVRLETLHKHLVVAGLGTISEIFDGDAPHSPQGCIAHAASVGEVLRIWRAAQQARPS
jgi:predicted glycogen debranching enzyme